ncbi:MAG: hypothetical protein J6A05_02945 [Oscillospiraceae bacterium]|nr:hypothetical protein [Oscillospiraceae bacterium]
MITNASCTIYNQLEDGSYKRTFIPAVFWRDVKGTEIKKFGAENASSINVKIFADQLHDYIHWADFGGDGWTADPNGQKTVIVKGNCSIEEMSEVIEQPEAYTINSAKEAFWGSLELWHVEIGAI